jgi:hypothetical protein
LIFIGSGSSSGAALLGIRAGRTNLSGRVVELESVGEVVGVEKATPLPFETVSL